MPKLPGINHQDAVRVLQKQGFTIIRQGKHIVLGNGRTLIVVPRRNPINAYTMSRIARDAGLTEDEFRRLV